MFGRFLLLQKLYINLFSEANNEPFCLFVFSFFSPVRGCWAPLTCVLSQLLRYIAGLDEQMGLNFNEATTTHAFQIVVLSHVACDAFKVAAP